MGAWVPIPASVYRSGMEPEHLIKILKRHKKLINIILHLPYTFLILWIIYLTNMTHRIIQQDGECPVSSCYVQSAIESSYKGHKSKCGWECPPIAVVNPGEPHAWLGVLQEQDRTIPQIQAMFQGKERIQTSCVPVDVLLRVHSDFLRILLLKIIGLL